MCSDSCLVVVGSGPYESDCQKLVTEEGVGDRVLFFR